MCCRCLEICTEGMLGVPQTPDFEEDAWKREDNLPALLAFTLEKNILDAREEHRIREEARAEELRRLALAELEVSSLQGRVQGLAIRLDNLLSVRGCLCQRDAAGKSLPLIYTLAQAGFFMSRSPRSYPSLLSCSPKADSAASSMSF